MEEGRPFLERNNSDYDDDPVTKKRRKRLHTTWLGRLRTLSFLTAIPLLMLLGGYISSPSKPSVFDADDVELNVVLLNTDNRMSTLNLCKSILTTSVLDYPVPDFVNGTGHDFTKWTIIDDTSTRVPDYSGGSLESVWIPYNRLDAAIRSMYQFNDDEKIKMVLIAEDSDTVLQLPPHLLLGRYGQVIKQANARDGTIAKVVFAAGKDCFTNDHKQPWCYLQHETAPRLAISPSARRPYLDSGFIMGPAQDVLKVLNRARVYQSLGRVSYRRGHRRYDHGEEVTMNMTEALRMVFAEQQLYRAVKGARPGNFLQLTTKKISSIVGQAGKQSKGLPPERTRLSLQPGFNYELGITLDYYSDLVDVNNVDDRDRDSAFIRYSKKQSRGYSGVTCETQVGKIPSDIVKLGRPIRQIPDGNEDPLLAAMTWSEMNLYTNVCTGRVPPAIIYRGAVSSELREQDWKNLWLQPHVELLHNVQIWRALHAKAERLPGSIILGADESSHDLVDALAEDVNVGDVRHSMASNGTVTWDGLCSDLMFGRKR